MRPRARYSTRSLPANTRLHSPIAAPIQVASLLKAAPHPNAGKLLLEFLTSEEGQRIFAAADYIPAMPGVLTKFASLKPDTGGFAAQVLAPEVLAQNSERWMGILKDLFQ